MQTIVFKDLITLEKSLLELNEEIDKFELDFNDALKLREYIEYVGNITSYGFSLQNEYYKKHGDAERLKKYHDKIMETEVEADVEKIFKLIERIKNEKN